MYTWLQFFFFWTRTADSAETLPTYGLVKVLPAYRGMATTRPAYEGLIKIKPAYTGIVTGQE